MTDSYTPRPTPTPGPTPATLAADAAVRAAGPGEPADHSSIVAAEDLLVEASMVREAADEQFDLGALARQAEVLTQAHDRLSAALEDAGRG
ncbi:hypothetical protein [Gordonia hydrophobica]|uniref:Uncharacterized protein n=1 Tax=Gordonia hydrophobica TaxID=40516 RepID=A0ABZ2TYY8_9ACTN|nr:hypothetical protein [Gordonia hydrophobica]MBM7369428.1 hypothetical protein [Gordonia hydrophobica]